VQAHCPLVAGWRYLRYHVGATSHFQGAAVNNGRAKSPWGSTNTMNHNLSHAKVAPSLSATPWSVWPITRWRGRHGTMGLSADNSEDQAEPMKPDRKGSSVAVNAPATADTASPPSRVVAVTGRWRHQHLWIRCGSRQSRRPASRTLCLLLTHSCTPASPSLAHRRQRQPTIIGRQMLCTDVARQHGW